MRKALRDHKISQRRACILIGVDPKTVRRERLPDNPEIRKATQEIAAVRRRFGYRRIGLLLERRGTLDGGFVVGARSFPGNPYDGHTLAPALEQVVILTDQVPDLAVVDRGYRGHGVSTTKVLISGMRCGITPALARLLKRRSAIEPEIGHMKMDGHLARCPLKGRIGDAVFVVLCACGHNIRKILAHLRAFGILFRQLIAAIFGQEKPRMGTAISA